MRPGAFLTTLSILGAVGVGLAGPVAAQGQDPRKDATEATESANTEFVDPAAPFSDISDFDGDADGPYLVELENGVLNHTGRRSGRCSRS